MTVVVKVTNPSEPGIVHVPMPRFPTPWAAYQWVQRHAEQYADGTLFTLHTHPVGQPPLSLEYRGTL